jgi:dynein heavy chain
MVEDISNILNAGEVPNLFPGDEVSSIIEGLGPKAKELGMADATPAAMWRLFTAQCRANLHVVLCMSPIGEAFRTRLRKFPALVNCCTIDWFTAWPRDALVTVAESFLADISMEDNVRKAILQMMCYFQESVATLSVAYLEEAKRNNYVTPTSYLELLGAFRSLLDVKRTEISTAKSRYDVGLRKLNDTAESVAGMQEELTELQPKLVVAKKDAEELMIVIDRDSKEASQTRAIVEKESAAADIKANEAKQIKEECEAGLAEAIPALEAAVKALSILKKDDITEVKMMKAPPAGVKLTMEAVCIMKEVGPVKIAAPDGKGKVDDFWEPAKKMMNDPKFLDSLVNYDKDNMKESVIAKIKKYVDNEDFEPDKIAKASKAAYGLCCWVRAMEVYDRVAKFVAPKRAQLAAAESEFAEVSALLAAKKAALKEVEDKLAALQAQFEETTKKKDDLEAQVRMRASLRRPLTMLHPPHHAAPPSPRDTSSPGARLREEARPRAEAHEWPRRREGTLGRGLG